MKLVVNSDTHGVLSESLPQGDVFIHCGDIASNYARDWVIDPMRQAEWFNTTFLAWVNRYQHQYKKMLFIFGNHDRVGEHRRLLDESAFWDALPKNVEFLTSKSTIIDGVKFYGSPYSFINDLRPGNWAFMESAMRLQEIHERIPIDTDIFISHTPPKYILDEENHYGCPVLQPIIENTNIKLVLSGHCHLDGGKELIVNGVRYVNAACRVMEIEYNKG